jgi:hypothetical protein
MNHLKKLLNKELLPKERILFLVILICLLVIERILAVVCFGSTYTDADQIIMWNGAMDYSQGVFREPFFYGQAYNYMLESFLSIPFLWMGVPVTIAVTIITNVLALLPYVLLARLLYKRKQYFWAYLCLSMLLILPINYTLLTAIPRGFLQAHLFAPLLFFALLEPKNSKYIVLLYLGAALCLVSNQSSALLVIPIFLYVYSFNFKSPSFYLKSLLAVPILIIDQIAKLHYELHPEKVLHEIVGMKIDSSTFIQSLSNTKLFEELSPFITGWGVFYPISFILLGIIALFTKKKSVSIFMFSLIGFLLLTLAIPKTQEAYPLPNAGIFFASSRLYLFLPLLFLISLYLVFGKTEQTVRKVYALAIVVILCVNYKFKTFEKAVEQTILNTSFPVSKNDEIQNRAVEFNHQANSYHIDLIIHNTSNGWGYFFDAYSYHPILGHNKKQVNQTFSICGIGDRRTWLYNESNRSTNILLNGYNIDTTLLKNLDYFILAENKILIKNNQMKVNELMLKLGLAYGL